MTVPAEFGLKGRALEGFLAFTARYRDVKDMRIATMGGAGYEAELWQRAGIASKNGWLIERNRRAAHALLASSLPYRVSANLSTLPRVFAAAYGANIGLDALHLDLCGTLEAQLDAVRSVLPLLFAKDGARCLAVTVADARRHAALEDFRAVWYRAFRLIGAHRAQAFLHLLENEQRAIPPAVPSASQITSSDPRKAARREFSLFVHLGELLRKFPFIPDAVERFVYVSRSNGFPFRMRTYFFHFVPSVEEASACARIALERWSLSPFHQLTETGMAPVRINPCPSRQGEKESKPMSNDPYANLRRVVGDMSPSVQAEFVKLEQEAAAAAVSRVEAAKRMQIVERFHQHIQDAFMEMGMELNPLPAPSKDEKQASVLPLPHSEDLWKDTQIGTQLILLRGKAGGASALEKAYLAAQIDLGMMNKKKWRPTVGSLLARTQGKHRGNFIKRALAGMTAGQRQHCALELAGLYSQISGQPVTVEMLEREAHSA